MPKQGVIASWTNYEGYKHFLVNARWIAGFVQRGKMTFEDAEKVLVFSNHFLLRTIFSAQTSITADTFFTETQCNSSDFLSFQY